MNAEASSSGEALGAFSQGQSGNAVLRPSFGRGPGGGELEGPIWSRLRQDLERAVRSVCSGRLADRWDDLVQAAMIKILSIARRGESVDSLPASYLYKVAHSALVDEIRRVRRRQEVPIEDAVPGSGAEHTLLPSEPVWSGAPSPEQSATSRQIGRGIEECLGFLVPDRRRAVTLWLLGHGVPESAQLLGWSRKRVENLVYRGLADLRSCLERKGLFQ